MMYDLDKTSIAAALLAREGFPHASGVSIADCIDSSAAAICVICWLTRSWNCIACTAAAI